MSHSRHFLISLLFLLIWTARSGAAPAYEVVTEFERPPTNPTGKLTYVAATGLYYGTTSTGGAYDLGTVFSMTPAGVKTTLVSFTGTGGAVRGANPNDGLVLLNSVLYGTTTKGGASDNGTVFRITTGGAFLNLIQFTGGISGSTRGSSPNGLVQYGGLLGLVATFYGTTQAGGTNDVGTLYCFTIALDTLTVLPTTLGDFSDNGSTWKGAVPVGPLVVIGSDVYGVTQEGGTSGVGTAFKYHPAGLVPLLDPAVFTTLGNFKGSGTIWQGSYPSAGLVLHPNGALYGTTQMGGPTGDGTVFKVATNATQSTGYTQIAAFNETNGASPDGELVLAGDNDSLVGTTAGGGDGFGTVFFVTSSLPGLISTLHTFSGDDGDGPHGALCKSPTGDLLGAVAGGGIGGTGTIFLQSDPFAPFNFQLLTTFSNNTGWRPAGSPAFAATGNTIYQPIALGGVNGFGTLLQVNGSTPSVLTNFGGGIGEEPNGGLKFVGGNLYGAAKRGGASQAGTIYQYQPGGGTTLFASLTNNTGRAPEGPLVQGPDGAFYTAAHEGGAFQKGAIIRIDGNGVRTTLLSFTGASGNAPGAWPHAQLAFGADGNIYGTLEGDDQLNGDLGGIFKYTPGGVYVLLKTFPKQSGVRLPLAGLTAGATGEFYGTTALGGAANVGTLFKITSTGTFTVLAEFGGASGTLRGAYPVGELLYAFDGALYGVAAESGSGGAGTIFRYKADNTVETLFDFTNVSGAAQGGAPRGGLVFGNDGFLYGATEEGGPRGGGVIYRIKNLGPMAVTDPISYNGLAAIANGRAQTGGESTTVKLQIALLPNLLDLAIWNFTPSQTTENNGIIQFSVQVPTGLLGQLINVRAFAQNSSGTALGIIRNSNALLPLQEWKTQFFGNANTPDLDDADNDGAKNLTEYGLLKDPTVPNPTASPSPIVKTYPEGARLAIFVTRDPSRSDVTIEVQGASSMSGPWTTVASSVNGAPFSGDGYVGGDNTNSGLKTVEIKDVPPGNSPARFLRVVVSH